MPVGWPPGLEIKADVPQMFDGDQQARRQSLGRCEKAGLINSVEYIPNWTLSGADTNYRTIAVYNRGTAGAGTALVASLALTSGVNLTRGVPKALTLGAAADRVIAVGDMLEYISTATGNGAPDAGGRVIVQHTSGT